MKTRTFKSNRAAMVDAVGEEFVDRWAEALMTSKQHRGELAGKSGKSMCCLGVACSLEGATIEEMRGMSNAITPLAESASGVKLATSGGLSGFPVNLNDSHLAHPQIAALLRGEDVTIEVKK